MGSRQRLVFRVHGMDCAEEVAALKRELVPHVGSETALEFDLLNGKLTVGDAGGVSAEQIMAAVARAGMRAEPWREQVPGGRDGEW
ncbi:MAG TPA: heavy-metal-associated domain-containing protein, partial [Planctomycetes bacterium]|nr:heavy-metal-associated domain-containing protein [Planctomycetota bacterium]